MKKVFVPVFDGVLVRVCFHIFDAALIGCSRSQKLQDEELLKKDCSLIIRKMTLQSDAKWAAEQNVSLAWCLSIKHFL